MGEQGWLGSAAPVAIEQDQFSCGAAMALGARTFKPKLLRGLSKPAGVSSDCALVRSVF